MLSSFLFYDEVGKERTIREEELELENRRLRLMNRELESEVNKILGKYEGLQQAYTVLVDATTR